MLRHVWASKLLTIFGHTNRDALVVPTEGTRSFPMFNSALSIAITLVLAMPSQATTEKALKKVKVH